MTLQQEPAQSSLRYTITCVCVISRAVFVLFVISRAISLITLQQEPDQSSVICILPVFPLLPTPALVCVFYPELHLCNLLFAERKMMPV
jgi:hypothetical protein